MELHLYTYGNDKQKECFKAWNDNSISDIVYGGAKGGSKSYTGCSLLSIDALIYPETSYFVARKKLNDLVKHTLHSFYEVFSHLKIPKDWYNFNAQQNIIHFHNGSRIVFIEAKYYPSDPLYTRFGSLQFTRGWIEEAGEFEKEAVINLMATVGRWKNDEYGINGKCLQTCNPAKNYLYKDYYLKHKEKTLESYKMFIQALPTDNKKIAKGYIDNLHRIFNKQQKERLLFGNWEYDDDPNALCDYEAIINSFHNDHIQNDGKKYLTCDVARKGNDRAVIIVWSGFTIIDLKVYDVSEMTEIQNTINAFRQKYSIPKNLCVADEDGVGGGIVDNCKIKGFINNSKATNNENYKNLQTQCIFKLAEKINAQEINLNDNLPLIEKYKDEIIEELEWIKRKETNEFSKLELISKEEIKQAIGRSPDFRDAIMMRMYFEVQPTSKPPRLRN